MKKIFAVSLIAVMAASASYADVVTTGYMVPSADGTYVKTNLTTGGNLDALADRVKAIADDIADLNDNAENTSSVAYAIDQKVGNIGDSTVTEAIAAVGSTAGTALKTVSMSQGSTDNGIITAVSSNGTVVSATKAEVATAKIADAVDTAGSETGIVKTQLASGVQTTLGSADSALKASQNTGSAGKYALVRNYNEGNPTYRWELIKRLGNETAGDYTEEHVAQ